MKQLDVYYRALLKYRELLSENRDCNLQRSAVAKSNTSSDKVVLTRKICHVDEDWVNAIENGLVFIEKAIKEDRQFIRSNGEVVPIEKVKNVSKASVEHLAKHSNLITKQSEGEDIIPDHLYTVEKLNDYAVYENRFLYMLLCYLRDFITLRYNKILELSNTYSGNMTMNKTVKLAKKTINYKVSLDEERRDDKYLRDHNQSKEIIDRIDLILKAVLAFLATPLMESVSKAPMIKPPITRTNVLKMNNNFKQALALYSYVASYDKEGFTVDTQVTEISPFGEDMADEFAESVLMSSFLTYEHSLGLSKQLKDSYEETERKKKQEEYDRFLEKMETIRLRIAHSGESPEEYVMMLEKQIRILEERCVELDATRHELQRHKIMIEECEAQKRKLNEIIEEQRLETERLKEAHAQELKLQEEKHEEHVKEIEALHAQEVEKLQGVISELRKQIMDEREEHRQEIIRIKDEYQAVIDDLNEQKKALLEKQAQLIDDIRVLNARLHALRWEHGFMTENDDFTTKESFEELEHTLEVFKKFYKKEWSKTKRAIRKEVLNVKNLDKIQPISEKKEEDKATENTVVNEGGDNNEA